MAPAHAVCSVCGREFRSTLRFCQTCANDSADPIVRDVPGIIELHSAYYHLTASPIAWDSAETAFKTAFPHALRSKWPSPLLLRARIEYAFLVLRRAGCEPSELPTSDLELFADRLDEAKFIYDGLLTDDTRLELERGARYPYGQLLREHVSLCSKLLTLREADQERGETQPLGTSAQRAPTTASVTPPVQPREGETNSDKYTFAYPRGAERLEVASTGIRCVKCPNHVIPLSPCPNCGGTIFMLSTDVLNFTGLSCLGCRTGFTSLKCVCGCQNPIQADTIMRLKAKSGGCFIATAACGDPLAPEVIALSAFRDDVLVRSRIGRAFVRLYYTLSPPVAAVVARCNVIRRLALMLIVGPAVALVGAMQKEPKSDFTAVSVQPKRCNPD